MSDEIESLNSRPDRRGGARPGSGRKLKRDKNGSAIEKAERQIRDRLPEIVDKMLELSMGILVQEETLAGPVIYKKPPDYKAAAYLIDRIMGKPVDRKEVSGPDGGPVPVEFYTYDAVAGEIGDG